jgi:nucleotide-binding universal stress UspA family protein
MRLIIGYDGSNCAEAALDDLRRSGLPEVAEIMLIMVTETWMAPLAGISGVEPVTESITPQTSEQREQQERAAARLRGDFPGWRIEEVIEAGSPAATILDRAEEWKADMIVVGSHGLTGIQRFFIGSVSQRIATEAHCSVRIARGRLEETEELPVRIVIAVDGSIDSDMAVYVVANRHWPAGSEVRLVTSLGPFPPGHAATTLTEERAAIERLHALAGARLRAGSAGIEAVSTVISFEDPKHAVVHEAESWGADSIFIGSRSKGRLGRFMLGSVSTAIATRAHCSVEIVRRTSTAIWDEETNPEPGISRGGTSHES